MLQLRATLPPNFEDESGLTLEGQEWMEVYRALLAKEGITNFQVVKVRT